MRPVVRNIFIIGAIVVLCILFISFVASRRSDGPDGGDGNRELNEQVDLANYTSSSTATLTTVGRVTSEEEHREIRITISPSSRRLEVIRGYQDEVIRKREFPNNQSAYEEFLLALQNVGFADKDTEGTEDDVDTRCPLGRRYMYELHDGSEPIVSSWSTSCSSRLQTFAGDTSAVRRLFELQIPGYSRLVRSVRL